MLILIWSFSTGESPGSNDLQYNYHHHHHVHILSQVGIVIVIKSVRESVTMGEPAARHGSALRISVVFPAKNRVKIVQNH